MKISKIITDKLILNFLHLHNYCSHGTQQGIFFNNVLEVQNILYYLYFPSCPDSLMPLDCRDLLYDFMLLSTIQMCLGVLSKKWKYFSIQISPDFHTSIVLWKVPRLLPFTELPKVGLGPSEKFVWAPSKGRSAKSLYTKADWLSVAEWLGLGLKGLICTNDK